MEYGYAKIQLKQFVGDAFEYGLPAVYVISNRLEPEYLKIGLVRYGDLQQRMGNFLTWSRGFKIHYVIYTDTVFNVSNLEKEIHNLLRRHHYKNLRFEPELYFTKFTEWFEVKSTQLEKLFHLIKTPMVNILKLHPASTRVRRTSNKTGFITTIPIKKEQMAKGYDGKYYSSRGRDMRKVNKTFKTVSMKHGQTIYEINTSTLKYLSKERTKEDVLKKFEGKVLKTDEDETTGVVVDAVYKKYKNRKQWRLKVKWSDGFEMWYSIKELNDSIN